MNGNGNENENGNGSHVNVKGNENNDDFDRQFCLADDVMKSLCRTVW